MNTLCELLYTDDAPARSVKALMRELSWIGTVAGSSVAYVRTTIPVSEIHDVDIFVGDEDAFNKALALVLDFMSAVDIEPKLSSFILEEDDGVSCITIAGLQRPIQLIMYQPGDPMSVISYFDLDYIRCGYHRGKFYCSDSWQHTVDTKVITSVFGKPKLHRLLKALNKGYRTPLLGPARTAPQMEGITSEEALLRPKTSIKDYFGLDPRDKSYDLSELTCVDLDERKFTVRDGSGCTFESEVLSVRCTIKSIYERSNSKGKHHRIYVSNLPADGTIFTESVTDKWYVDDAQLPVCSASTQPLYKLIEAQVGQTVIFVFSISQYSHTAHIKNMITGDKINQVIPITYSLLPYDVKQRMAYHTGLQSDKLHYIKAQAYQAFEYCYLTEKKPLQDCIDMGCGQMKYDFYKHFTQTTMPRYAKGSIDTIYGMMQYIDSRYYRRHDGTVVGN